MAGLGFKDFQVGEVLTSADVDGYLMQQSVMRFADSGARGSALGTASGTAVALAEGMVTYLDDTDAVAVYNGSDWIKVGALLSVNTTTVTGTFTTTSSSDVLITGVAVTVTPTSSSSKFIVILNTPTVRITGGTGNSLTRIYRNASPIYLNGRSETYTNGAGNAITLSYVDSPATASSVTYEGYVRRGGGSGTVNVEGASLIVVEVTA